MGAEWTPTDSPARGRAFTVRDPRRRPASRLRLPLYVFALAAAGLTLAGFFMFRSIREGARRRGAAEIDAVAALKVSAVNSWREEAEADMAHLASYPVLPELASRFASGLDPHTRKHATVVLESFARRHQYEAVALLTPDGRRLLEWGGEGSLRFPDADLQARALESSGAVSALNAYPDEGRSRLDVATAVRDPEGRLVAVLHSRRNAQPFLASIGDSWPVPSETAESVVLRRDGDSVLFVTDPRFLRGWALRKRIPLSEESRGAVRAIGAGEGVHLAVDYRGTPVLVAARRVPNSDWILATRMDLAEVEAPMLHPAASIAVLLGVMIAACAVALALWWRREIGQHRELESARAALEESEERFRLALAGTHWVWDWDLPAGRLSVDPQWAAEMALPSPTLTGSSAGILASMVYPDDLVRASALLERHASGADPLFEVEFRVGDLARGFHWILMRGQASCRDASGRALRITGVFSDHTERRRLQEQLERSELMASLGTLAAGVAHEINNPLAYVLGNLDFVERELRSLPAGSPELTDAVAQAREGGARVRDVVRSLQAFSRPGSGRRGPASVEEELTAALRIADNEIRHRARLQVRVGPLPRVTAAPHELGQVFLNVLLNAAQAIPEGRAAENTIAVLGDTTPQGFARIEIRDSGTGIPEEALPRIFEPFFTTKPQGAGTGLGLAIAHGIVSNAGGRIDVESEVGRGTLVRILLPPTPTETPEASPEARREEVGTPGASHSRILVVDDDPLVARSIARALSPAHEVVTARSATEALACLERGERFEACVCDLMMPETTGMELYEKVRGEDPRLAERFVFVTGGAFTDRARDFLVRTSSPCLEKPFDPVALLDVVSRASKGSTGRSDGFPPGARGAEGPLPPRKAPPPPA